MLKNPWVWVALVLAVYVGWRLWIYKRLHDYDPRKYKDWTFVFRYPFKSAEALGS